jgi:biopolymer transport protein ExbD
VFEKWHRTVDDEPADLELIPVMNLFMVLIPFLLLGAAFIHIGVIPTSTPTKKKAADSKEESDEDPKSVMANLVVTPDEMKLSFSGSGIPQERLDELGESWSIGADDLPLDQLQKKLLAAKKAYPESNTVTVLPHDDLEYQRLVTILDKTREHQSGETEEGDPKYEPIFPVTVFSKFIPAKEGDKEGEGSGDEQGGG